MGGYPLLTYGKQEAIRQYTVHISLFLLYVAKGPWPGICGTDRYGSLDDRSEETQMIIALLLLLFLLPILLLLLPARVYGTLRSWSQTLHWEASLLLASLLAFLGYSRIDEILGPPIPLSPFLFWALKLLALLSPACLAVVWLRWIGVKWETALWLLPLMPVGAFTIWLMRALPYYMS